MSSVRKDDALYAKIEEYFVNNPNPQGHSVGSLQAFFKTDRSYFRSVLNTLVRNRILIKQKTGKKGKNNQPAFFYFHHTQPEIHNLVLPQISPCIFTNNSAKDKHISAVHPEAIINSKKWKSFVTSKKTHIFFSSEYKKLK